jgi:hypothetical protein
MLSGNVELYSKLGIPKLDVHANINVGGYSWAKYGYVPHQNSWNELSAVLEKKITSGDMHIGDVDAGESPNRWEDIPFKDQSVIQNKWMRATRSEFHENATGNQRDNIEHLQQLAWAHMDRLERYRWARNNDVLPEVEFRRKANVQAAAMASTEKDALLKLVQSKDPKAIWAIADSKRGKELLLSTDWFGKLDLKDKESMDRFRAYVKKGQ